MKNSAIQITGIDYDFCRNKKMSVNDLFIWLELDFEYGMLELGDACLRSVGANGEIVDISKDKSNFDRWANSVDLSFDLLKKSERKSFIDFVENKRMALNI